MIAVVGVPSCMYTGLCTVGLCHGAFITYEAIYYTIVIVVVIVAVQL